MAEAFLGENEISPKKEPGAFWESSHYNIEVVVPTQTALPAEEGLHFVIQPKDNGSRDELDNPRRDLMTAYFALPVAKIVAESRFTQDFWANIHKDRWGMSVYGRNPQAESAWAKPVNKRSIPADTLHQKGELREQMQRYLPLWERNLSSVTLFEKGVEALSPQSQEYQKEVNAYEKKPYPYKEDVLWVNNKFVLVNVRTPHLSGVHLVVHPRETYWKGTGAFRRPWQTHSAPGVPEPEFMQAYLEAAGVLLATQQILKDSGQVPFFNPETHFSGNWSKDLLPEDKGGRLDVASISDTDTKRKDEKRLHRPGTVDAQGDSTEFRTAMHGHLYATSAPDKLVHLPSRPQAEVGAEWKGITPLKSEEVDKIRALLQQQLTMYLSINCEGLLQKHNEDMLS